MAASNDVDTGRTDAYVLLRYVCANTRTHTGRRG